MIQRIQSLFLLLIIMLMTLTFFFDYWHKTDPEGKIFAEMTNTAIKQYEVTENGLTQTQSSSVIWMAGLCIVSVAMAGFSISQFNNRKRQLLIGGINTLVIAGVLGSVVLLTKGADGLFSTDIKGDLGISFYLVVVAFVANIAANRFIQRDEKIVKSMDNFRD